MRWQNFYRKAVGNIIILDDSSFIDFLFVQMFSHFVQMISRLLVFYPLYVYISVLFHDSRRVKGYS